MREFLSMSPSSVYHFPLSFILTRLLPDQAEVGATFRPF